MSNCSFFRRKMNEKERLLIKVANLYYRYDLTQQEIAARLRLSRQKVQRLLRQAREEGIVQINIRPLTGTYAGMEEALEKGFGLKEAVITEASDFDNPAVVEKEVGSAAADYLSRVVKPGDVIAISWGGTLLGMVNALPANPRRVSSTGIRVVQALGGLGDPNKEVHAADLTRRLAQLLGGEAVLLPAPGVAGSRQAARAFYTDPFIQQALDLARHADLAVMGIGAPREDSILIREGKIVSWPELEALRQKGAVGDINLRYFDKSGKAVPSSLDKRVVGLSIGEIRSLRLVVGIAGGPEKVEAIRGALAGQLVDVLVTDHVTAERILEDGH
jgi:DNA-binding transcriptional regulator LsrR (DeoR family)